VSADFYIFAKRRADRDRALGARTGAGLEGRDGLFCLRRLLYTCAGNIALRSGAVDDSASFCPICNTICPRLFNGAASAWLRFHLRARRSRLQLR
jgi:hypothetical protein